MPLLKSLTAKVGKRKAREEYNAYHREYRERNKAKMLRYWKKRRTLEKARKSEFAAAA